MSELNSLLTGLKKLQQDPGVTRITHCDPAEALGKIMAGKPLELTCPHCRQPMTRDGNTISCSCSTR